LREYLTSRVENQHGAEIGKSVARLRTGGFVMHTEAQPSGSSELTYLDASRVTSPVGVLSNLSLLAADGEPLGTIEGVVIDAAARRVRYFEVQSKSGWFGRRRYLLEADQLAQVEPERNALRLRIDHRRAQVHDLDSSALRDFSDDDLLTAMFRPRVA
jgi:hypothetical protein